jgi:ketosteroid isomerase-like protein
MRNVLSLLLLFCFWVAPALPQSPSTTPSAAMAQTDSQAIQQIEDDMQNGENTTDIAVLEQVLADDYVNLTPRGLGPTKAEIMSHLQPLAGQTPPYALETKDMRIYVLGDAAVAAYTKTYKAKENGNVVREDTTHIFKKEHGTWKLKISRASIRKDD